MFVALAAVHATALLLAPSIPLVAIGLWWNANTISHNFIHRPFFRSPAANRGFSICLTLLVGVPQSIWRDRHLRHHAETARTAGASPDAPRPIRQRLRRDAVVEIALLLSAWAVILLLSPRFFLMTYVPGWLLGLGLCQLQGYFEHARGVTSHYGRVYNFLLFNDGYHVEHHARPGLHWSELKQDGEPHGRVSRWPPILRWLEYVDLHGLERFVLRSAALQRFVLDRHERAFASLLNKIGEIRAVTIVGGGLFPRTALVLRRLLPGARLTIVDADSGHLEIARHLLQPHRDRIAFVQDVYGQGEQKGADLIVIPLSFVGDRQRLYRRPPAPAVLVHDWIWAPKGSSAVVSWWLLKRLNLVVRA